jgi:hypothetical protein
MAMECLFDKVSELTDKFKRFFQQKKKVAAMENFSSVGNVPQKSRNFLMLIKTCLNDGFLDQEDADFLDRMIRKHELNYLDWSHKTKWLKEKMNSMVQNPPPIPKPQMYFDFDKKPATPNYPIELFNKNNTQPGARV